MDPKVRQLVTLIDQAVSLLRAQGSDRWAAWLEGDARLIRALDLRGVEHLLQAYGGMGSLNDELVDDNRLRRVLSQIYRVAAELRREELSASPQQND